MTTRIEDIEQFSIHPDDAIDLGSEAHFPEISGDKASAIIFRVASYMSEPLCKTHQYLRQYSVVDALHPNASRTERWARKFFFSMGVVLNGIASIFTTIPGIALRHLAKSLQQHPFIYFEGNASEKKLEEKKFTFLSWNVCFVSGGYSISDGGVTPWEYRIGKVTDKVKERDADVVCLYEVFDNLAAFRVFEDLKDQYSHFYFNVGPKSFGPSSGIFVASKYKMANPEFIAYPKDMLVGRTKNSEKGVFSFDLQNDAHSFARIFTTHLQHSEEPMYPTEEEVIARKDAIELILGKMDQNHGKATILAGDLNLDDEEFQSSFWKDHFEKGDLYQQKT